MLQNNTATLGTHIKMRLFYNTFRCYVGNFVSKFLPSKFVNIKKYDQPFNKGFPYSVSQLTLTLAQSARDYFIGEENH